MNKITAIKGLLVMASAYWREKLEDHVVEMYAEDLAEFAPEQIASALKQMRRDPKVRRFPLPAEIAALIAPPITPEDDAKEAATRILGAVPKFGWANPTDARAYIGELGWRVVEMQGGWQYLCETLKPSMVPTLQAQFRELAKTTQTRALTGTLDLPPGLPGSHDRKEIEASNQKQKDWANVVLQLAESKKLEEA